jgi:regulator of replication initiation timing
MVRLENEIARLRELFDDRSSELNPLHEMVRQASYRLERWISAVSAENERLRFENERLRKRIADAN